MRHIFRLTIALASLLAANSLRSAELSDQLGIQTWTLRNLKFDQVVEFAKKHGIKNLQMIGNHMDPKAPVEETKRKKAILDAAGLKGERVGGAEVSTVHANFIINRGGATAADVITLVRRVRERVQGASGVTLEPEVLLYGGDWRKEL